MKKIILSVIFGLSILFSIPKAAAFDFGSMSAKDLNISKYLPKAGMVAGLAGILYGIYNIKTRKVGGCILVRHECDDDYCIDTSHDKIIDTTKELEPRKKLIGYSSLLSGSALLIYSAIKALKK